MAKRRFRELPGIYEPSAVQQLPDGRVLVVEDEAHRPYSLLRFTSDKDVTREELWPKQVGDKAAAKLLATTADLEGMDVDGRGYVYVINSHARRADGKRSERRSRLLRFRLDGDEIREVTLARSLLPPLLKAYPALKPAARERDVKRGNGLNIEALAFNPDQDRLLIGFRSPVLGDEKKAVIAVMTNPGQVFSSGAEPAFCDSLTLLDLEGGGLRGMAHIPGQNAYFLVSGRAGGEKQPFRLWHWRGGSRETPTPLTIKGLKSLKQAEGISPLALPDREALLVVSDDGDEKKKRGAGFLVFDYSDIEGLPES